MFQASPDPDLTPIGPPGARRIFRRSLGLLSVLAPLALLADLKASFYDYADWDYHLWMVGYFGAYFRHHLGLPTEANAAVAVGMAAPLFYGYLLYPALGFLSAFLGAALAVRVGCLLLVALQFYALMSAGRAVFQHRGLAYATAVTVIWSTYSLTNLYNRSAIPEFFATGCLMAATGFLVSAAAQPRAERRGFQLWLAGVSALLAIGMHPPTAVVSGVFLAAMAVVLAGAEWAGPRRFSPREGVVAAVGLAAGALVLSSWVYVTSIVGPRLVIWGAPGPMMFAPDRFDSWMARLAPLPFDAVSARLGVREVSTPFLEAPIAFGLLILLGWLLVIWGRSPRSARTTADSGWVAAAPVLAPLAIAWFVFLVVLSLSIPLAAHFVFLGTYLQFAYRLVSHANAALLVAVLAAGAMAQRSGAFARHRPQAGVVAAIVITMAAMALGMKLEHGSAVIWDREIPAYDLGGDRALLIDTPAPYLVETYTTPGIVGELGAAEAQGAGAATFAVGREGHRFGRVSTTSVQLDRPGWVVTNALVFPWSRIRVNGVRWAGDDLRRRGSFLAVHLPAGKSVLEWEWHPDPIWAALRWAGGIAFALVMLITVAWALARTLIRLWPRAAR